MTFHGWDSLAVREIRDSLNEEELCFKDGDGPR